MLRTLLSCVYISACLFMYVTSEERRNVNDRGTNTIPQSSADVIMKEDAEEVFYNLDVDKYEGLHCPPPAIPENGYLIGEGTQVGTVVYVKCHEGYWLSGSSILACTPGKDTAKWDPSTENGCIKGKTFFDENDEDDQEYLENEKDATALQTRRDLADLDAPPFLDRTWMSTVPEENTNIVEQKGKDKLRQEVEDRIPAFCLVRPQVGPCRAIFRRYYFDKETMECTKFYYGGCGGNKNNFENIDTCMSICKGYSVLNGNE